MQRAIGQLATVAILFAMRSCEYLKVTQAEKQRTDILRLLNLRFFRDGKLIEHNDPHLEFSDCISITFEMQKKDDQVVAVAALPATLASSDNDDD